MTSASRIRAAANRGMRGRRRQPAPGGARPWILIACLLPLAFGGARMAELVAPGRRVAASVVALFTVALAAAEYLVVRFRSRDDVIAINMVEAVLAPMLLALPAGTVVVSVAVAQTAAGLARRNRPVKLAFNVAQWALSASSACLVASTLAGDTPVEPTLRVVGAVAVGITAATAVNFLAFAVLLRLVRGRGAGKAFVGAARSYLYGWTTNLAFGTLFFSAFSAHPLAVALFFVPLIALHRGVRGYAGVLADRQRLAALHRATEALATPVQPREALTAFTAGVRECFQAPRADLLVATADGLVVHRATTGSARAVAASGRDLATAALFGVGETGGDGAGPVVDAGVVARHEGFHDCIAAPLGDGGDVLGVLIVFDPVRVEGREAGERAVFDSLAGAAASALHKARLLDEIFEQGRRLSEIVGNASDGIFTLDPGGCVLTWNPAMAGITGHRGEAVVGRAIGAVVTARDENGTAVVLDGWTAVETPLPEMIEVRATSGEWRLLSCSYTTAPGSDGRPATLIVVARDKTRVRELERLREDFVAAVSHELRTPITPIKGFAATLLRHGDTMDAATRMSAVRGIARQADRLERLITNLLEISKVERGVVDAPDSVGATDAAAAAQKVVSEFRASYPERELRVAVPTEPLVVRGEALWIEQIVSNLVSNAMKYSPASGPVEVSLGRSGDTVEISVTDSGPGIAPEDRERVFERFRRLSDPVTRSSGGAGLGLYLSRQLAHMMDGELVVAPSERGARFLLTLPAMAPLAATG